MCYVCNIFIGSLREIVSVLLFCPFSLHFYLYIYYCLCNDAVSNSVDIGPYYSRQFSWVLSCNVFMNIFSLTYWNTTIRNTNNIQGVPKPMSQTSPGYSPPLIKQKKFLSTWVQEQVPRYPLTFMCGYPLSIT